MAGSIVPISYLKCAACLDVDRLAEAPQVGRVLSEEHVLEAAAEVGRAGHAVERRLGGRVSPEVVVSAQ